ncbi:MAG: peptide-methionine (S)-S-oxide reductase MsrA [Porticoccaceae bacterium]|nr:peptide-methionine (S)-S-oxide reductase MsrA [Porticoccaceae bacterium]
MILPLLLATYISFSTAAAEPAKAIFAGGCFWCMEQPFDALDGVLDTTSGYTGGHVPNPDYREVSSGETGHTEALLVTYDPNKVSYEKLLEVFWHNIDLLDGGGQFCDRGSQYRSEIFVANPEQRSLAGASKQALTDSGKFTAPIATEISDASTFYPAEDYHQNYYKTNPTRYKFYKWNCGRQQRLDKIWGADH